MVKKFQDKFAAIKQPQLPKFQICCILQVFVNFTRFRRFTWILWLCRPQEISEAVLKIQFDYCINLIIFHTDWKYKLSRNMRLCGNLTKIKYSGSVCKVEEFWKWHLTFTTESANQILEDSKRGFRLLKILKYVKQNRSKSNGA